MKLPGFYVRDLRNKDIERVLKIRRASFVKEFEIFGVNEESVEKELKLYTLIRLVEKLTRKVFSRVYVGELKGQVVGSTCLNKSRGSWHIQMVMVDPKYRRQGYGRKLVLKACNDAASLGAKRVILHVLEKNIPAKNLYESMGFISFEKRIFFHTDTCKLDERKIPSGYQLVRIGIFNPQALSVLDTCRDEGSAKVYGKSHFPPFYVRIAARILRAERLKKYAIVRDTRWVGVYTFSFKSNKKAVSTSIYICEKHRGQGIEEFLLTRALNEAFELGANRLTIALNDKNGKLKEACEKLGFSKSFMVEGMFKSLQPNPP